MDLRPYQRECVDAIWAHARVSTDPAVAVLPTGAGKSLVAATLAKDTVEWGGRIICLSHVRELVEQVAEHIGRLGGVPVGVYSAGLNSRDVGYPVTVAGIQSVYKRAEELGKADVILVDEAHRIPADGEGQYRTFLEAARAVNPDVRLVGLTATPYRMGSGHIYGPDQLFRSICYQVGVRELIVKGYLSHLKSKTSKLESDTSAVPIRGGEFVATDLQQAMMGDETKVAMAVMDIAARSAGRRSVLVFCSGIAHATMVAAMLRDTNSGDVGEIYGDTRPRERDLIIEDFRAGRIKYLVNVEVLTTGFDAPGVDCIALLRPTMSPGLHYQMIGRGLRKADGKADCLVLDYSGNLMRHGPIDRILIDPKTAGDRKGVASMLKTCPSCEETLQRTVSVCPECGHEFAVKGIAVNHGTQAADVDAISQEDAEVHGVEYLWHRKKGADESHPAVLRVSYDVGYMYGPSEWVCLEHPDGSFAKRKAAQWWRERSDEPVPKTVLEALAIIQAKGIKEPARIMIEPDGKYWRIVSVHGLAHHAPDEIPF